VRVVLRPVLPGDLDALEAIFASPEVAAWWVGFTRTRIASELLQANDPNETIYAIEASSQVLGIIQSYEEPDPEYRSAGIDIAVGPEWHGTGVALDALRTLARHLFDVRGHDRLTIDPTASNGRAVGAYAKVGFRPVGIMRAYWCAPDGTRHDGLLMDMLRGELH
jgi:aminoglycoside 6'-N-acetyltransferase